MSVLLLIAMSCDFPSVRAFDTLSKKITYLLNCYLYGK